MPDCGLGLLLYVLPNHTPATQENGRSYRRHTQITCILMATRGHVYPQSHCALPWWRGLQPFCCRVPNGLSHMLRSNYVSVSFLVCVHRMHANRTSCWGGWKCVVCVCATYCSASATYMSCAYGCCAHSTRSAGSSCALLPAGLAVPAASRLSQSLAAEHLLPLPSFADLQAEKWGQIVL